MDSLKVQLPSPNQRHRLHRRLLETSVLSKLLQPPLHLSKHSPSFQTIQIELMPIHKKELVFSVLNSLLVKFSPH